MDKGRTLLRGGGIVVVDAALESSYRTAQLIVINIGNGMNLSASLYIGASMLEIASAVHFLHFRALSPS
jgi:hypothetical protein